MKLHIDFPNKHNSHSYNDLFMALMACMGATFVGSGLAKLAFPIVEKEVFSGPIDTSGYTFDELRALGCPNDLLMQYACLTKEEVNQAINLSKDHK